MKKMDLLINLAILLVLILLISLFLWQRQINLPLREELNKKNEELKDAANASLHLEKLEKQSQNLQDKEKELYKMVPSGEKQPLDLIKTLTRIAREAGLREITFEIRDTSSKSQSGSAMAPWKRASDDDLSDDAPAAVATAVVSSGMSPNEPKPTYLEMNFEGTFVLLLNFLEKINNLERLVTIEEINIERSEKILPYQKISMQLIAYSFPNQ